MHTNISRDITDNEPAGITPVYNDTLAKLTAPAQACKIHTLPSWSRTVTLLEDLYSLQLTSMDYEKAGETLSRVVDTLKSQVEICIGTGNSHALIKEILVKLPNTRQALRQDVETALQCDPAATSTNEIVLCYPGLRALAAYRTAHAIHCLGVPLLPRLMTEIAHSRTGIDIHPAAKIGRRFFIDHGTGIVIGETCIIGNDVKVYQGVTLGARSFPRSSDGHLIRGHRRHPTIGDKVTIFAGATILGPVNIGSGSVIGGNVWVTSDVAANSKVTQRRPKQALDHGTP